MWTRFYLWSKSETRCRFERHFHVERKHCVNGENQHRRCNENSKRQIHWKFEILIKNIQTNYGWSKAKPFLEDQLESLVRCHAQRKCHLELFEDIQLSIFLNQKSCSVECNSQLFNGNGNNRRRFDCPIKIWNFDFDDREIQKCIFNVVLACFSTIRMA